MPKTYECQVVLSDDGAAHIKASVGAFSAKTRLSPARALALKDFLTSPDTEWERDPNNITNDTIRFLHETGKIHIYNLGTEKIFDPDNEESMIRMVRHLMRRASAPVSEKQISLPGVLPTPTPEELAKRTILSEVGSPEGIKAYKKPKPRYNPPTASQLRSKELIDNALAALLAKGL